MFKKRNIIKICSSAVLFVFVFLVAQHTNAATLLLSPSADTHTEGDQFTVTVKVDTQDVAINAIEGVLKFDTNALEVVSTNKQGSIMNLWVQDPSFSNTLGTVRFGGIVLNPGYDGSSGTILQVRFHALKPGTSTVTFSSGSILANDGIGSNVLSLLGEGTYTINSKTNNEVVITTAPTQPAPTAQPAPAQSVDQGLSQPVVIGPVTNGGWTNLNEITFSWDLSPAVDTVAYLFNQKPQGGSGSIPDGRHDSVTYDDLEEGSSYFHIRFRDADKNWGPISHYEVKVDRSVPEEFDVEVLYTQDLTHPQPEILFSESNDEGSGVSHYRIRVGEEGDWIRVEPETAGEPYLLLPQPPGRHTLIVEAHDFAGNVTSAETELLIESIVIPRIDVVASSDEDTYVVEGYALPRAKVHLYSLPETILPLANIYHDVAVEKLAEIEADETGFWSAEVRIEDSHDLALFARAVDDRGAVSQRSEILYLRDGVSVINNSFTSPFFMASILLLLMIIVVYTAKRLHWVNFTNVQPANGGVAILDDDDDSVAFIDIDKLQSLKHDMHAEIHLFDELVKRRSLRRDEQYIHTELQKFYKKLEDVLSGAEKGVSNSRKTRSTRSRKKS